MNGVPALSIVIPVLDEAAGIEAALGRLQPQRAAGIEVIVVDGGSSDDTVGRARPLADAVILAPRGRGCQMNAGADAAHGEFLLFLHADTELPPGAVAEIGCRLATGHRWGRFNVSIEGNSAWFPLIAFMMNQRSRLTGIATGDQAIFVRRETFVAVGRFPDIPLMEDIALSTALCRIGRPYCSRARVTTSGRRWERHGVLNTILRMASLRLRYFLGADPTQLAADYGYRPRPRVIP